MLDDQKYHKTNPTRPLPSGWNRVEESAKGSDDAYAPYYMHISDPTAPFKHLIPLQQAPRFTPNSTANSKKNTADLLLSCETTRAFFRMHSILRPGMACSLDACAHVSVFDHPIVVNGPRRDEICDIFCLQDTRGGGTGFLRLMGDRLETDGIETELGSGGEGVELIAISTGCASRKDLRQSFEDHVDARGRKAYNQGLTTVYFDRSPPGTGRLDPWQSCEGGAGIGLDGKEEDGEVRLHFSNVLWIQWKEGVAYRRAAGRIPKWIWEDASPETVRVTLG